MAKQLIRRLTFYRWESLVEDDPFDRVQVAKAIERLPASDRITSYGEFWIDVLVVETGSKTRPTKLMLLRLRDYDNRPYVYEPGSQIHPVAISERQSITDIAHVALYPDNTLVIDQGGHAPRPSALAWYTSRMCDVDLRISALMAPNIVERLRTFKGLRSVELRARNSQHMQHQANSELGMFAGLRALRRDDLHEAVVKTEIAVDTRGEGGRGRVLPDEITEDVIRETENAETHLDTLRVVGVRRDGGSETLDLLKERLQVTVSLPRAAAGGHLPDSEATFSEIAAAKKRLTESGEIERAAQLHTGG